MPDVFPPTQRTWIDRQLDRGASGQLDVNSHLMQTYYWPLKVYYLGTNLTWLGEPEDVVSGFFASRLDQVDFIGRWQASGMRLRRWLMNAFCYYLLELRRARQRDRRPRAELDEPVTFAGDPDAAFDRAAAVAFVRQAMDLAARTCREEGLDTHWEVFRRHHLEAQPFRRIAEDLGLDEARAAVMSRTATRKFRSAMQEVLVRDGIDAEHADTELRALLEAMT